MRYDASSGYAYRQKQSLSVSFIALQLMTFVIPFRTLFIIYVGGIAINIAWVIGFVLLIAFAARQFVISRIRVTPSVVASLLLCWWVAFSSLWSVDSLATIATIVEVAIAVMIMMAMVNVINSYDQVSRILYSFVMGCSITVCYMIWVLITESYAARRIAVTGIIITSETLAISLPIAAHLLVSARHVVFRMFLSTYIPLSVFAIALTGSRTGLVMAAVAGVVICHRLLTQKGASAWAKSILIFVIGVATVIFIVNYSYITSLVPSWQRISQGGQEITSGNFSGRYSIWVAAWNSFGETPFIGKGAGAFSAFQQSDLSDAVHAHNTALSLLSEVGLVGLILFCVVIVTSLSSAHAPQYDVLLTVLLLVFVSGLTGSREYSLLTWLFLGLSAASRQVGYSARGLSGARAVEQPYRMAAHIEKMDRRWIQ